MHKREKLNDVLGLVEKGNPFKIWDRMTELTRQQGQTTEMILALPDDGNAIIMTANHGSMITVRSAIRKLRPIYPIQNTLFISPKDYHRDPSVTGVKAPVFIDNSAVYTIIQDYIESLNMVFNPQND